MADKIDKTDKVDGKNDPLIGTTIGDYRIASLVGVGGMARVYEAYNDKLQRRVALKLLTTQIDTDEEAAQRFWREARTLANLDHPNIVTLYDAGEYNHSFYILMKFIEGKTVLTLLKKLHQQKKFMDPEQLVSIMTDTAAALDYAHSVGIIHRDIKPSNIMLTSDGRAILTDFGLTMELEKNNTQGTAFGTPRYIAPEQAISSHRAVPQSDIYSLGVVIYEIVTGQAPFDDDSPMSLALSHITNEPPTPRSIRASIPPDVEQVLLKALKKRPEDRYQTAVEMVEALRMAYGLSPVAPKVPDVPKSTPPPSKLNSTKSTSPKPSAPSSAAKGSTGTTPAMPAGQVVGTKQGAPLNAPAPVVAPNIVDPTFIPPTVEPTELFKPANERTPKESPRRPRVLRAIPYVLLLIAVLIVTGFSADRLLAVMLPISTPPISTPMPTPPPRVRLIYSKDGFTIYNPTGATVNLHGITFVRGDGSDGRPALDPAKFIGEQPLTNFANGQCLRIRLNTATDQTAPFACPGQSKLGVITDATARFWLPTSDKDVIFTVKRDQAVLQTCLLALNTCEVDVS